MNQQLATCAPQAPVVAFLAQAPDLGSNADNLWRIVGRCRWRCLAVFCLVSGLGALFLVSREPSYTARTVVVAASRQPDLATTDHVSPVLRTTPPREPDIESEVQIMISSRALSRIVRDLHLERYPEFQPALRAYHGSLLITLHGFWDLLIRGNAPDLNARAPAGTADDAIVELIRKRLKVEPIGRTTTVEISFTSHDSALAAQVSNAIAGQYIDNRHSIRVEDAERAATYLRTRASELREALTAAEAEVERFRAKTLRSDFDHLSSNLVTLKDLERQADVSRAVYEAFLGRVKVTEQVGFNEAQSWVISPATAPITPSSPNVVLVVGATLILAAGAAVSLALLVEHKARQTVLSTQHFVDKGLKALGIVPDLGKQGKSLKRALLASTDQTGPAFSESLGAIFTSVLELEQRDQSSLVLLVTSALPWEGKSTTAVALAAKMANAGKRVLLIDADLRAPRLHHAFGISTSPGLTECLDSSKDTRDAIHYDPRTGIAFLPAGARHSEPQNVLRSPRLFDSINTWRASYDFIVVDAPPVLPISDARILAPLTDFCIFVTRWRTTRWTVAMHALRLLRDSGVRLSGIVISKVDIKQLSTYEFADSEVYGRSYRRYTSLRTG